MDDLLDLLKKVAPAIAGAIGTPAVGMATEMLINAFDGDEIKARSIIDGTLIPSQDDLLKIKQADQAFALKMAELTQQDKASARQMAVDGGVTGKLFWLSVFLLTLTVFGYLLILFFGYDSELDDMVVGRGLGYLENLTMAIIGFWYGTSFGSQQKTEIMAKKAG